MWFKIKKIKNTYLLAWEKMIFYIYKGFNKKNLNKMSIFGKYKV
jgi:hypothetical protein